MDQDLIDIKLKAMAMKMMRFTMKSIAITGYYGDTHRHLSPLLTQLDIYGMYLTLMEHLSHSTASQKKAKTSYEVSQRERQLLT